MKLHYDYDLDPRYGWYRLRLESKDTNKVDLIIDDAGGGTLATYDLNTETGEITPSCMCNAWSESECACGNY